VLKSHNDEEIVSEACRSLSFLAQDGSIEKIQAVVDCKVLPIVLEMLQNPNVSSIVKGPAMNLVGNVGAGNDAQKEYMIDRGVLKIIYGDMVTCSVQSAARTKAFWIVSNFMTGSEGANPGSD